MLFDVDDYLRRLEREAAISDVEARANVLLKRVRQGELKEECLRLPAYLGDAGSRMALGLTRECPPENPRMGVEEWADWVYGLFGTWGNEAVLRAALAAVRATQLVWAEGFPEDRLHLELAADAEAWVLRSTGCDPASLLRRFASPELAGLRREARGIDGDQVSPLVRAAGTLHGLLQLLVSQEASPHPSRRAARVFDMASEALATEEAWRAARPSMPDFPSASGRELARACDAIAVLAAIRAELIPWALGYCDPLAERVETRAGGRKQSLGARALKRVRRELQKP